MIKPGLFRSERDKRKPASVQAKTSVCLSARFWRLTWVGVVFGAVVLAGPVMGPRAQQAAVPPTAGAQAEAKSASEEATAPASSTAAPETGARSAEEKTEDAAEAGHGDPVAPVLYELVLILLAAKIGGHIFDRLNQPAVLGELVAGVLIGSITLWAPHSGLAHMVEDMRHTGSYIDILARLGVILLLFEVGVETELTEMLKVGISSTLVATYGVVVPMILGFLVSSALVKTAPPGVALWHGHLFIGAILCATSVGITARVLKDLGKVQTNEARIILGAAVIDDVMGLIILAVVAGIVQADLAGTAAQTSPAVLAITITIKAVVFMVAAIFVGVKLAPYGFMIMARLRGRGLLIVTAVIFCFLMSYLADLIGLAPIVGAFASGLVLGEAHIRHFGEATEGKKSLENLIHPLSAFLVPVFFVLMGIQVNLETFRHVPVLLIAAGLTVAAIIGKQVCGLGVVGTRADRMSVGLGMIPRGEVGLIFASVGKTLKVVDDAVFSAIVIMVVVTTLITPPFLKWSLMRLNGKKDTAATQTS